MSASGFVSMFMISPDPMNIKLFFHSCPKKHFYPQIAEVIIFGALNVNAVFLMN
jgi:hypothetical protein